MAFSSPRLLPKRLTLLASAILLRPEKNYSKIVAAGNAISSTFEFVDICSKNLRKQCRSERIFLGE